MEEILSSIRQAINEDIPGTVPETTGDPFASGSSAEAAFATPPPGQAFDATVHETHDPFAELTRKLNETRESVQKQMHGVSSNLKTDQPDAFSAPPAESPRETPTQQAPVVPTAPLTAAPEPQRQVEPAPADAPVTQSAPTPSVPKPEPHPLRAAVFSSDPAPAQTAPAPKPAESSGGLAALTARVADEFRAPVQPASPPSPALEPAQAQPEPKVAAASAAPQEPAAQPAPQPKAPELKWSPPETPAPSMTARPAEPAVTPAIPRDPKPAPKVETSAEEDPFPKLTAIVERASLEKTSSAKTDDAMVDLVLRRILEPAVKSWLDENLPKIVTEVVREEVRRVAEQAN